MLKIIANLPWYIGPLFLLLLVGGLRARKTSLVPLAVLLLIPAGFLCWSLYTFFSRYATDPLAVTVWVLCLASGFICGFLHTKRLDLQIDQKKKSLTMPGSFLPLILSMGIFSAKLSAGIMRHVSSEMGVFVLALELFSAIILGIFIGRGICCLYRYRSSHYHVTL